MSFMLQLKKLLGSDPDAREARDKIRFDANETAAVTLASAAELKRQREIAIAEAQYAARIKGKRIPAHR